MAARRPSWPQIRAALVALHLIAIIAAAIPAPVGGMSRGAWKEPTVQAEFETWSRILGIPQDRLEDGVFRFATIWMQGRRTAMRPIGPYLEATGTDQPWRMFVAPHRFPARYQVQWRGAPPEGEALAAEDGWQTLFEERSTEHRWRETFFEQERVRSIVFRYAWPDYGQDARRTCEFLGRTVWDENSEAAEVRCRYWKARSPSPAEARAGEIPGGAWTQSRVVKRPAVRSATP